MDIKVLDGDINLYKESPTVYIVAFGNIKENSIAKIKIKIEDVKDSSLTTTCGCQAVKSDEKNVFEIEYKNTNITQPFSKVLVMNYIDDSGNKQAQIKLTGNVIK